LFQRKECQNAQTPGVGNICFIRAPQKEHVDRTYDAPMWDERKLSGHHQDDNLMIKKTRHQIWEMTRRC
jgi:hypothetical protein